MIFDDLKNITFYKGIHPNLDKAIDFCMRLMEIKSF
ncbi:beta-galactosidase subunit beta [Streptococcus pneumoniae]|nr:beta-galactosidase subunit beta [Streptococcus pneumoniae]